MPASDALTLHTQVREQCDNPLFRTYVDEYARQMATANGDDDEGWMGKMGITGLRNALNVAETFYISPNMHEVVRLAAEDFPRDETVLAEDQPSEVGFLYLPAPLRLADPREGRDQICRAMLWFHNRIWLFGDILDPDDWQHHQIIEQNAVPTQVAATMGRWQLVGYSVFNYNQPIPTVMHRGETVDLGGGLEFPMPRFEQAETITYLLAAWRLMQQSLSEVTREVSSIPRPIRRRAERMHLPKSVTVIELRRRGNAQEHGTGQSINYRYLRRGHWRRVWCGPLDGERYQRAVYIHPRICGPDDAPLIVRDRVQALMR